MKKNQSKSFLFKSGILAIAFTAMAGFTFTSCSDDDDEGGGGSATGSENAGVVEGSNGEKLYITRAGYLTYEYDSDKRIRRVYNDGDAYNFSYNPFRIEYNSGSGYDSYSDVLHDISVNSKGHITRFNETFIETDYDEEQIKASYSLSYDNSGHLTKLSATANISEREDGKTYSYKATITYNLKWVQGNLDELNISYRSDGEKEDIAVELAYDEDALDNVTGQYTPNTFGMAYEEENEFLIYAGYFGVGSRQHPTSSRTEEVYEDEDDGERYTSTSTFRYRYSLNSNGSVEWSAYAMNNSTSYEYTNFGYMYANSNNNTPNYAPAKAQKKTSKSLFRRLQNAAKAKGAAK